jgi:tRNA-dihydrouridine synthase 2
MPIATASPLRLDSPPALKRQKLEHDEQPIASPSKPTSETEAERVEREMGLPIEFVKMYEHELDYRNKLVLAPMVRTGSCESIMWTPSVAVADGMQCQW